MKQTIRDLVLAILLGTALLPCGALASAALTKLHTIQVLSVPEQNKADPR